MHFGNKIWSSAVLATMLAAASTCQLPGDPFYGTVKLHVVPLVCGNSTPAQEALAFSSTAGAPRNIFEIEYEQAWDLVDRYFLYRERLGGWSLWKTHFQGQLNTPDDAQSAIDKMISSLKDDYTYYRDTDATTQRQQEEDEHDVVKSRMLPGNIGYMHLSTFNSKNCIDEASEALEHLSPAHAYILDLRSNKGGSITNAFHFFSLFVNQGKFVKMSGFADGTPDQEELSLLPHRTLCSKDGITTLSYRETNLTGNKPLIVLVDGTTKSAAEMVAGALRDDGRALLLGTKTFGKGVIQRVWEFDDGTSIKITAARYYLPHGESPHGVGLKPNLVVANKKHDDAQLKAAQAILTSNHVHLTALNIRTVR
jgi:C-terminal processing protease CtpA/Prc